MGLALQSAVCAPVVAVQRSAPPAAVAPADATLHRWALRAVALAVGAGLGVGLLRLGQGGAPGPRAPGDGDAR